MFYIANAVFADSIQFELIKNAIKRYQTIDPLIFKVASYGEIAHNLKIRCSRKNAGYRHSDAEEADDG